MIVAADEGDIHNLLESFAAIGLRLRTDVPFDIALLVKYFFRDAKPSKEAKVENSKRREEYKLKEELKSKKLYEYDNVDVIKTNSIGWRTISRGQVVEVKEPYLIRVRLNSGVEIDIPKDCVKLSKSKSPIDSWPDEFIFFERVLGLLRGLSASLNVTQSYLDLMTPYARLSLSTPSSGSSEVIGLDTNRVITNLLHSLVSNGDFLGCQVCVIKNGNILIDLAAGVNDPYHRKPTCHDTKFCCFSVTKGVTAAAIHMLCEDGLIELDAPISKYWPEFGQNDKSLITVADVLDHKSGLQHAGTEEFAADPYLACDTDAIMAIMENAVPDNQSGYHYLSFGFILDGLVRRVTSMGLKEFIDERICGPLGLGESFSIGHEENSNIPVATHVLNTKRLNIHKSSDKKTTTSGRRPIDAPSLLMNPTFLANNPRIQRSSLPAANGFFSARTLAKYYNTLTKASPLFKHNDGILNHLNSDSVNQLPNSLSNEEMLQGNDGKFSGGFMLYPRESSGPNKIKAFGHSGLGGSIALCDISSGDTISIAITTNRLSFDSVSTKKIIREIYKEIKIDPPYAFLKEE